MTRDFSTLSDEELFKLAGTQGGAAPTQPTRDFVAMSDEELFQIVGPQDAVGAASTPTPPQETINGGFNPRRGFNLAEFAKGTISGIENVGLGIIQTAADLGLDFDGAKSFLATIRPDLSNEILSLTSEDISESVSRITGRKRISEEERGGAFKVGRFVGEVAPYLPVGAKAGLVKGGAIGGGAISGLAPLEEAGIGERAKETVIGTGIGAGTGGLLKGLGVAARGIGSTVKRLTTAAKPEDILAARLPEGQTAKLLEQLKTATPESPVLLPDIAGDDIVGLTGSVGRLSGGSKDIIREALEGRSKTAVERVSKQLARDISGVDTYFGSLDDIVKARSKIAKPFYDKAFAKNTKLDPVKDAELLKKIAPDIKDARKKFRLDKSIPDNSIIMLDNAKKSLDDKIGAALRQGENQQARALQDIKTQLVDKLDELNPDYKKARQVFSDFASIENAQKEGLDFTKRTSEELERMFKQFTVSEKEAFRIGVRENLQRRVGKTGIGADPAKKIFGKSQDEEQLKVIFKDKKSFNEFKNRMLEEIQAADIKFKVLGGSQTQARQIDDVDFVDTIIRGGEVATGNKTALIGAVRNSVKNIAVGLSKKNATDLAKILVRREASIEALENILKKEQNVIQKRVIGDFIEKIRPSLLTVKGTQTIRDE